MSKSIIVDILKTKGATGVAATETTNEIMNAIVKEIVSKGRINFPELGTFKISERKKRQGVNIRTREKIVIPAKKRVTFKMGTQLSKLLNETKRKPAKAADAKAPKASAKKAAAPKAAAPKAAAPKAGRAPAKGRASSAPKAAPAKGRGRKAA